LCFLSSSFFIGYNFVSVYDTELLTANEDEECKWSVSQHLPFSLKEPPLAMCFLSEILSSIKKVRLFQVSSAVGFTLHQTLLIKIYYFMGSMDGGGARSR
jgi:hypothetical protein